MTALAIAVGMLAVGTMWGVRRSRHIDSHIAKFLRDEDQR